MWETKETSPSRELRHGHTVVGRTPVPLTNLSFKFNRGVLVRAPGAADSVPNTDIVFIGGPNVTADTTDTGGLPLVPGSAVEIPIEDPSLVYAVSGSESQDLAWLGV
jgi:hypothetical protein